MQPPQKEQQVVEAPPLDLFNQHFMGFQEIAAAVGLPEYRAILEKKRELLARHPNESLRNCVYLDMAQNWFGWLEDRMMMDYCKGIEKRTQATIALINKRKAAALPAGRTPAVSAEPDPKRIKVAEGVVDEVVFICNEIGAPPAPAAIPASPAPVESPHPMAARFTLKDTSKWPDVMKRKFIELGGLLRGGNYTPQQKASRVTVLKQALEQVWPRNK